MTDPDPATPDLELKNLVKEFDGVRAVDDVSFAVPAGSFFSILGPSGCGKTTLLRMVAGFAEPTSGDILIKGRSMRDVAPNRRPVNMVFQHLALFPMMSVGDNVAFGLRRRRVDAATIRTKVGEVLERVGLPGVEARRIDQLSGGQKQRIAIARCMVLDPDVLLLDEPLGALDLKLREHMKVELKKLQSEFNTTFVYITHDQSEALVMSDQVAVMNRGVFEQVGAPRDLYYDPKTAFVAGFVGDSNRWRGKVETADPTGVKVTADTGLALAVRPPAGTALEAGAAVEVFVRPEAVRLGLTEARVVGLANRLSGEVADVLFNGANSRVLVRAQGAGEIDVAIPQTGEFAGLERGRTVHVGFESAQAICFPAGASPGEADTGSPPGNAADQEIGAP